MSTTFAEMTLTAQEQELLIEMAWAEAMEEAYDRDWTEAIVLNPEFTEQAYLRAWDAALQQDVQRLVWNTHEDYKRAIILAENAIRAAEWAYTLSREQVKIACQNIGWDPMKFENILFNPPCLQKKGKKK